MKAKSQSSTKEKIFDVSLDLFSEKGYDNVSIREIAKNVGIKESSIYNHYSKKEDILDSIFEYYKKNMILTKTYYENVTIETKNYFENKTDFDERILMKMYHRGSQAIKNQWKQPKMRKILRLMFIELYHDEKIRKFFIKELINRPIDQWTSFFKIFIDTGIIVKVNPNKLAKRYHKYGMFLLFELMLLKYDENLEESKIEKKFDEVFDEVESHFKFILNSLIIKEEK